MAQRCASHLPLVFGSLRCLAFLHQGEELSAAGEPQVTCAGLEDAEKSSTAGLQPQSEALCSALGSWVMQGPAVLASPPVSGTSWHPLPLLAEGKGNVAGRSVIRLK